MGHSLLGEDRLSPALCLESFFEVTKLEKTKAISDMTCVFRFCAGVGFAQNLCGSYTAEECDLVWSVKSMFLEIEPSENASTASGVGNFSGCEMT